MPKDQRVFTKEFKLEAVQLAQKSGKPQAQIARDLGIAESTLHHWCKEFSKAGERAFPGSGNPPASEEEVRHLRRENELLRQERDVLKKPHIEFLPNEELIESILKQPLEPSSEQKAGSR